MKKLVIFDLDGTLVNTIDDLANATNYALKCLKMKERTKDEVLSFIGNGIRKLLYRALGEDETYLDTAYRLFKVYYHAHCLDKSVPYDGIFDLLKYLKEQNIKMCVVSNKEDQLTKKICSKFFSEYMDLFIGERTNIPRKPDPVSVLEVIEKYHVLKEEALYIGDSEVDFETAKNAGIDSLIVTYGFRSSIELGKLTNKLASNPSEISTYLMNNF